MRRLAAVAVLASLAPAVVMTVAVRPVAAAALTPYEGYGLTALAAGARTGGDVGASGGLVTLDSGSGSVVASLDGSPSGQVVAAPYEPGPLFRTVVGQVNASAGQQVLVVPDAEASYPGQPTGELAAVPEQTAGPLIVSGGSATARAGERAVSGTSTGSSFDLAGVVTVDASTSSVTLKADVGTASGVARTAVGRVSVGGVLELRDVVANATVTATGDVHRAEAHLSIGSISVAGQEVGLTDQGVVAAGTTVVPGTTLQQATDAANAALSAAGIAVAITDATRHVGPREAAADTGGVRITLTTADLPGGVAGNRLVLVVGGVSLTENDTLASPAADGDTGGQAPGSGTAEPPGSTTVVIPGIPGTPGVPAGELPPVVAATPTVPVRYEVVGQRLSGTAALAAFGVWQFLTLGSVSLYSLVDRRRRLALLEAQS